MKQLDELPSLYNKPIYAERLMNGTLAHSVDIRMGCLVRVCTVFYHKKQTNFEISIFFEVLICDE